MKTASYENCKRLHQVTGWEDTSDWFVATRETSSLMITERDCPKYDLDYLLNSTPIRSTQDITTTFMLGRNTDNTGWSAVYRDFVCIATEPADAVCQLLIKIYEYDTPKA